MIWGFIAPAGLPFQPHPPSRVARAGAKQSTVRSGQQSTVRHVQLAGQQDGQQD